MAIQITGGSASAPAASETVAGVVELATTIEAATGTDTVRAVTPAGLALRKIGAGWALGSGGNARGTNALDLQESRYSSDNVASGNVSVIIGGVSNKCTGTGAVIIGGHANVNDSTTGFIGPGERCTSSNMHTFIGGGYYNAITGNDGVIGAGKQNQVSGGYGVVVGGLYNIVSAPSNGAILGGGYNTVSANYGWIGGGKNAKSYLWSQFAHAGGNFSAAGDAQQSILIARKETTNATPAPLFLDGGSAKLAIADDTTWAFTVVVVARRTDANNESAAYRFEGCVDRNAGTTALVGTVTKTVIAEDSAGWDCNVTADDTNDALVITATGEAGKTIRWVARIELVEVTG